MPTPPGGVSTIKHKKELYCAALSVVFITMFVLNALSSFELKAQDALYRSPGLVNPDIYVFGIDEAALAEFGPFQFWSRQRMADAISVLNSAGDEKPAVIAVDILYSGLSNEAGADEALVNAAEDGGNVVFGAMVSFNWNGDAVSFEKPFDALRDLSDYGVLNAIVDVDGVVRKAITGVTFDGIDEPTFSESIYLKYMGEYPDIPESAGNSAYIAYTGGVGDYYGALGLGTSFRDIFDEDFDPSFYADSIILIGPYAAGLMDSYFTPADSSQQMYGVEIHANILQMMLDENYKSYAPFWMNLLALVITLIVFTFVCSRYDVRLSFAALIFYAVSYVFCNRWAFGSGVIYTLIYPLVSAAGLFIFSVAYNYATERAEKQKIKDMFKKYVDPKLVDSLILQSDAAVSGIGAKKHFAVLFVDIRGFTPMSEKLKDDPETIVAILNDYLELTSSCVFDNGGSVDKFIGDATMALFNGFTPLEDYTFKAAKAALDIIKGAKELNGRILEKYGISVGFGVGVHCGYAVVGNIGPHFRKDYTAIGDTVNTAARLESNAAASQALISKDVYDMLEGRITAEHLGEIAMKGKKAIDIFSLTGIL